MQALSKATPGETYTIQWMFGQPEVLDFLHSHSVDGFPARTSCGRGR